MKEDNPRLFVTLSVRLAVAVAVSHVMHDAPYKGARAEPHWEESAPIEAVQNEDFSKLRHNLLAPLEDSLHV